MPGCDTEHTYSLAPESLWTDVVCPDDLCMTNRTGGRVDSLNGLKTICGGRDSVRNEGLEGNNVKG